MARGYVAPDSVSGLVEALANATDPILIAGGQSLLPAIAEKGIRSGEIIDIGRIAELRSIAIDADGATVGAGVVMAELMHGPIAASYPAMAAAAAAVGNHVVRGRSTVGGCLAWANPRAELPMILIAHDAMIVTQHRSIPANALMSGAHETILRRGEVILRVRIPNPPRMVFDEIIERNSTGRAMVAVACAEDNGGEGGGGGVRVTLAGLTVRPIHGLFLASGADATTENVRAAIGALPEFFQPVSMDYRIWAACTLIRRCRERLAA